MKTSDFTADTPLSALFREYHYEELRTAIESWRPCLIGDDPSVDALSMTDFQFDKRLIRLSDIYLSLCRLIRDDALRESMRTLAAYLFRHSNLSCSENSIYVLLKRYKRLVR